MNAGPSIIQLLFTAAVFKGKFGTLSHVTHV